MEENINYCVNSSYDKFFKRFLRTNGVGTIIAGQLTQIVDIIYKACGLAPDPEDEWKDYFVEEGGGFAIIEFTITSEQ